MCSRRSTTTLAGLHQQKERQHPQGQQSQQLEIVQIGQQGRLLHCALVDVCQGGGRVCSGARQVADLAGEVRISPMALTLGGKYAHMGA